MKNKIERLGHATVRISGEKIVYVDPWKVRGGPPADVILVTHSHHDHCSPDDVNKLMGPGTIVVAPADCVPSLGPDVRTIAPGDEVSLEGVQVKAVPAYNIGKSFHPRENGWVGYVITMGGERVYVSGDTDAIPEMKELQVDVAIVPVGGTYTMTAREAAEAVNGFGPAGAIPVHYGDIVGSRDDAEEFARLCESEVQILG